MTPSALAVVVPAHDEERRISACLRSLRVAAAHVAPLPVLIVVAADACTDATASLAAREGARVVETRCRNVGAARAAGIDHALERRAAAGPDVWLAMTDADSTVPAAWLAHQIAWARRGYDAVLGTIRLAPDTAGPLLVARHDAEYFRTRRLGKSGRAWEHPHVHGANLGVSAAAYRRVGGFAPLPTGEDRDLAARLFATGHRIARTDRHPVRTSARLHGRAPGGLADLLAHLHPGAPDPPAAPDSARAGFLPLSRP
ncbi:glycosyl transferase [Streptomyces longisporoflavus]|uniref:glycosyltransferase n=1 Tax=Streptomyces longisporoflavus TaxID=28044 RepID=UPI00167EEE4C|nr:glycosyltransferase [Streptomyces longisporoflavus]GGV26399.1 glycosyl transferase [Streptomyces longisporoflavus]